MPPTIHRLLTDPARTNGFHHEVRGRPLPRTNAFYARCAQNKEYGVSEYCPLAHIPHFEIRRDISWDGMHMDKSVTRDHGWKLVKGLRTPARPKPPAKPRGSRNKPPFAKKWAEYGAKLKTHKELLVEYQKLVDDLNLYKLTPSEGAEVDVQYADSIRPPDWLETGKVSNDSLTIWLPIFTLFC